MRGDRYYPYRENGAYLLYYEGEGSDGNDGYLFDIEMPPIYDEVILRNDEKNRNVEAWYELDGLWYELDILGRGVDADGLPCGMNDNFMPIETWGNRGRIWMGDRIIR